MYIDTKYVMRMIVFNSRTLTYFLLRVYNKYLATSVHIFGSIIIMIVSSIHLFVNENGSDEILPIFYVIHVYPSNWVLEYCMWLKTCFLINTKMFVCNASAWTCSSLSNAVINDQILKLRAHFIIRLFIAQSVTQSFYFLKQTYYPKAIHILELRQSRFSSLSLYFSSQKFLPNEYQETRT